eukprot:9645505-Alexandrium_andersonii.AAC.1
MKVFHCAVRRAAPPWAAAMVAALVSTLVQGPSQTFAARAASARQMPRRSSPSPAGEATVAPR